MLQNGDKFALLPNEYWYKIKIYNGGNNTSFLHNFLEVKSDSNTSFSHNSFETRSGNKENCRNKIHTPAWCVQNSVQLDPVLLEKRVLDVSETENEQPGTSSACKRKNSDFGEPENTKVIKHEVDAVIKSETSVITENETTVELQGIKNEEENNGEQQSNEQEAAIKMEVLVHNDVNSYEETEQPPCNSTQELKRETLSDEEDLPADVPVKQENVSEEDVKQPSSSADDAAKKEDGADESDNKNAQDDSGKKKKFRDRCWYGESCYRYYIHTLYKIEHHSVI